MKIWIKARCPACCVVVPEGIVNGDGRPLASRYSDSTRSVRCPSCGRELVVQSLLTRMQEILVVMGVVALLVAPAFLLPPAASNGLRAFVFLVALALLALAGCAMGAKRLALSKQEGAS